MILYNLACYEFIMLEGLPEDTSYQLQSVKILSVPPKYEISFGAVPKCYIFQYCNSFIEVLSIALHLDNALQTLRQQKLSILTSLLSFLYCSQVLLFSIIKVIAKSKKNLSPYKSEKEQQLFPSR